MDVYALASGVLDGQAHVCAGTAWPNVGEVSKVNQQVHRVNRLGCFKSQS